ncbi:MULTISPECIES: hypothetical protein [unclassified Acinetobacter]|uniref:hypothetical protein n=1 Tax=unclassified Acinetobacter TaxID=196816 RepID=UPI0015D2B0D7|nr:MULTISPECIES: hypothetical protein [unclassified Acinetobacter]UUS62527.1 hypothetical protein MST17_16595 [Acinetobacter sp. YH16056_T]
MTVIDLMYSAWFVLPLMLYMTFGLAYFVFRGAWASQVHARRFTVVIALSVLVICGLFYYILPVPKHAQNKMVGYILILKDNNQGAEFKNVQNLLSVKCQKRYLNAVAYFQIQKAYQKDFDVIFNRNKFVDMGSVESITSYKKEKRLKLCDLKDKI